MKIWYVFLDGHHQGPYTEKEIVDLLASKKISSSTTIWQEGWEDWVSLVDTDEFSFLFIPPIPDISDLPPSLPPLPDFDEELSGEDFPALNEEEIEITDPGIHVDGTSMPELPSLRTEADEDKTDPGIILEEEIEEGKVGEKKSTWISSLFKVVASFVFLFLLLGGALIFYLNYPEPVEDISLKRFHLPVDTQNKLMSALNSPESEKERFAFAFSGNKDAIIATTNIKGKMKVAMRLRSIPGKILGEEDVEMIVRGEGKGGLYIFPKLSMKKGKIPFHGHYQLEMKAKALGKKGEIFKIFKEYGIHKLLMPNFINSITYKTDFLYFPGNEYSFEEKLKDFHKKKLQEKLTPLQDEVEKYRTFVSLLEKIQVIFEEQVDKIRRGNQIRKFEARYAVEVGPILQEMIIDNIQLDRKFSSSDVVKAQNYRMIAGFGKKIGEIASDMMTEVSSLKKVRKKDRERLKGQFKKRVDELANLGRIRISKVQEKISTASFPN